MKELLELSLHMKMVESNKEGNFRLDIGWPKGLTFQDMNDTRNLLIDVFTAELKPSKVFKMKPLGNMYVSSFFELTIFQFHFQADRDETLNWAKKYNFATRYEDL